MGCCIMKGVTERCVVRLRLTFCKSHRDCRNPSSCVHQSGDLLIIDNNFNFVFGSDQPAERIWIMILGIPHPQTPCVPPPTFIVLLPDWDPCLGLEVPWPRLRPSNLCPLTWALLIAMSPSPTMITLKKFLFRFKWPS